MKVVVYATQDIDTLSLKNQLEQATGKRCTIKERSETALRGQYADQLPKS